MLRSEFFRYVIFSDEATFYNNGQLNRHTQLLLWEDPVSTHPDSTHPLTSPGA